MPKITAITPEEFGQVISSSVKCWVSIAASVCNTSDETRSLLYKAMSGVDMPKKEGLFTSEIEKIAEQYDAFVDIWYYFLNCAAKKGVNLSKFIFNMEVGPEDELMNQVKFGGFNGGEKSQASKVWDFTTESGTNTLTRPGLMTTDECIFIIKMAMSELLELALAMDLQITDIIDKINDQMDEYLKKYRPEYSGDFGRLFAQFYPMVELWNEFWLLSNTHNVNIDQIFDVVHKANMDKKWPDGKFHKRADGKIIKPEGWTEPDIVAELIRQESGPEKV